MVLTNGSLQMKKTPQIQLLPGVAPFSHCLWPIASALSCFYVLFRVHLVTQMVKNLPLMQETQVQFLGQEDPLEKEMATHSRILAWEIP